MYIHVSTTRLASEKSSDTQSGIGVPQYLFLEIAQSLASLSQLWKRLSWTNSGTLAHVQCTCGVSWYRVVNHRYAVVKLKTVVTLHVCTYQYDFLLLASSWSTRVSTLMNQLGTAL